VLPVFHLIFVVFEFSISANEHAFIIIGFCEGFKIHDIGD